VVPKVILQSITKPTRAFLRSIVLKDWLWHNFIREREITSPRKDMRQSSADGRSPAESMGDWSSSRCPRFRHIYSWSVSREGLSVPSRLLFLKIRGF